MKTHLYPVYELCLDVDVNGGYRTTAFYVRDIASLAVASLSLTHRCFGRFKSSKALLVLRYVNVAPQGRGVAYALHRHELDDDGALSSAPIPTEIRFDTGLIDWTLWFTGASSSSLTRSPSFNKTDAWHDRGRSILDLFSGVAFDLIK